LQLQTASEKSNDTAVVTKNSSNNEVVLS